MSSHMLRLVGKVGRHQNANLPRSVLQYAVASTDLSQRIHIAATHRRAITTSTKKNMSTIPSSYPIVEIEHQHQNTCTSTAPLSEVDFTDATSAHGSKSTFEILRAIAVFNACQFPWLVEHAEGLLGLSTKLLGSTITNTVVKHTFFKHFCAGEDSFDMKPVIDKLQQSNIGPILDYAAESEGSEDAMASSGSEGIFTQPPFNQPARVYDYKSECECDRHVEVFKNCIRSVQDVSPTHGFAALKVTALGNPELLERMSTMIVETKKLFSEFDKNGTGFITPDEFIQCYEKYFYNDDGKLSGIIELLECDSSGMIDYISFSQMLSPYTLPAFTLKCKDIGPLALATPSDDEIVLMKKMSERLHILAEEASRAGTKLLVDAEHLKYQPAIDNLVLELQQKYNAKARTPRPIIFNTYQCYLKDTPERIMTDLRRSERFSFHFAAKLVRGAYMVHERERAKKINIPSPIHDNAENTHLCYNAAVELLLRWGVRNPGLEIMVASHNKESIEKTVRLMSKLGISPNDRSVHFAQLYGMSDNLSFTLGNHGYSTFKYLPYGEVGEVMPYLLRRAQENSDMLGNAGVEIDLLKEQLRKRLYL